MSAGFKPVHHPVDHPADHQTPPDFAPTRVVITTRLLLVASVRKTRPPEPNETSQNVPLPAGAARLLPSGPTDPALPEHTDEQLFEAFRDGDDAAFRTLIERHREDLLRFLRRLVGDPATAEDVFQDAFMQVYLSADAFDSSRRFRPWLFTIAANKGRDALRKSARRRAMPLSAPVQGSGGRDQTTFVDLMEIDVPSPGSGAESRERDKLVQAAVDDLPPALREILLLAYFQRLSYAQIAAELGIPLGTVKSRLHSAVASFAKAWQARASKAYGDEDGSAAREGDA